MDFETSWEKGKAYFISPKKCQQLVHFTAMIEATSEKYKMFNNQVVDRDTEIFVTIPALVILKCLDDDDKGICRSFFPPMFGEDGSEKEDNDEFCYVDKDATHKKLLELKRDYLHFKNKSKNEYDFFNLVERSILGMENDETPSSNQTSEPQITDKELKEIGLERKEMH